MKETRNYYNVSYINDNLARQLETLPDDELWEQRRKREHEKRVEDNRRERLAKRHRSTVDFKSFFILMVAASLTMYMSIQYLIVNADIMGQEKQAKNLETQIMTLKTANDAAEQSLEMVDLDEIYRVATEELGMVFANNNQVISYASKEDGYVRQFSEIEDKGQENKMDSILESIKNFTK